MENMLAQMGMPAMPMTMADMHRRMAMLMMEHFWHLTHFQARHFYHYVTQPSDTLGTVAERFGTTAETLRHWNCLPGDGEVWPGLLLTIPCPMKMKT